MASSTDQARSPLDPQLRGRVTTAITTAFFAELAEVGYGRLSVDSIVKRAGVGKAAVYRRWPTKKAMAIALITEIAAEANEPPDTGSFEGDVVALTKQLSALLLHPLAGRIIPAVAAEMARDDQLDKLLRETIESPRRQSYAALIRRGIERGEIPADCDLDLALDMLIGPLYWRILVRQKALDFNTTERVAKGLAAAVAATRLNP
jgi:AcrR family transcriptional regulator